MNATIEDRSLAGQAVYSKTVLAIYDLWVHGISNHLIWKCPTRHLQALYDRHVTGNHMDVGVGTGYFLARCRFPVPRPRLVLIDANRNSLDAAARRLRRYRPRLYRRDVLKPLAVDEPAFDSIAITYLLHCLPGNLAAKASVFDHLTPFLAGTGVIFGATILGATTTAGGRERGAIARRLMAAYNARGIFSNTEDDLEALRRLLDLRYAEVELATVGCVALFSACRPVAAAAERSQPPNGDSAWNTPEGARKAPV